MLASRSWAVAESWMVMDRCWRILTTSEMSIEMLGAFEAPVTDAARITSNRLRRRLGRGDILEHVDGDQLAKLRIQEARTKRRQEEEATCYSILLLRVARGKNVL